MKGSKTRAEIIRDKCLADKDFMDGVRRGLADAKAGRMTPWSEVKEEFGLK